MDANVRRVSFLYTNGDKKRKEFNTLYAFPLSTITNIKIVPMQKEEEE